MQRYELPTDSLQNYVPTEDVALIDHGKYANLYQIEYKDECYYEVVSNSTFEVIYRTFSRFFAIRRFMETNQD